MQIENLSGNDEIDINQVISIQSEKSILQKAAEEINKLSKHNLLVENLEPIIQNEQHQIQRGEITPFQAIEKKNDSKSILRQTFKESTQLLDLEKYLMRQAELAKQKSLLKKRKISKIAENEGNSDLKKKIKIKNSTNSRKTKAETSKQQFNSRKSNVQTKKFATSAIDQAHGTSEIKKKENNINNNMKHLKDSPRTINSLISEQTVTVPKTVEDKNNDESGSEYIPSDDYESEEETLKKYKSKKKIDNLKANSSYHGKVLDDGDEDIYRHRVETSHYKQNKHLHKIDHLFKVPQCIWKKLYKYQKVSVKWLWELHTRNLGGLLGDEMGLGKTVQIIAFLAGLDCSELLSDGGRFRGLGPTLIICPATLLEQWVKHFHDWYPTFRTVTLHQSGTFQGNTQDLLHTLIGGGILVTSYSGVLNQKELLLKFKWHYVILDEGHKIRNPEAKISKVVKSFLTPHRLLLTGSPMQNSLKELWSLFDFILPGKLGTLPAFMEHCAGPITRGGYANASHLQEATALQVATMLKDAITPYMLRRTKLDVQHHVSLPDKNEQVLFCSLTDEQRQLYKEYLSSDDVSFVLHEKREGKRYRARLLVALTALRKLCNHPDLFLYSNGKEESNDESEMEIEEHSFAKLGHWKRAGKMTVTRSLLKIWKKQEHRVLLFTQSRQMMHVLEGLVQKEKYNYLRMDGTTPMNQRQSIVSKFNNDASFFVFLLTTRVGGLGVNLTGANRVIIYDPDWNPATDAQARERAWRIGQNKNVTIYRLITAGTIEEKMYHRQIYKILLSNKVLEDPRQRRLFRTTDLIELFNLNEPVNGGISESDQLFHNSKLDPNQPNFTSGKIKEMKKLASELSKKIGEKASTGDSHKQINSDKFAIKTNYSTNECKVFNKTNVETKHNIKIKELDSSVTTNDEFIEQKDKIEFTDNLDKNKYYNCADKNEQQISNTQEIKSNCQNELEDGEIVEVKSTVDPKLCVNSSGISIKHSRKLKNLKNDKVSVERKNQKKNRKENRISANFEGERVSYLIGRSFCKSEVDTTINSDDHYVLSKLFSKAAVSSAFQHDSVLSNAVLNSGETTLLQKAAKESAFEKMDSIRQSRKWCWKPSWDKLSSSGSEG